MRILSVAQPIRPLEGKRQVARKNRAYLSILRAREICGDGGVVRRSMGEGFRGKLGPHGQRDLAVFLDGGEDPLVVRGVANDGNARVVLGGGADHRRAADIDVFDDAFARFALGDRALEGIEVDNHEVDRDPADALEISRVDLSTRENAAVHPRVKCLDAPVHHLGRTCITLDGPDGNPLGLESLRGSTARQDRHSALSETPSQRGETTLVGDRDQGGSNRHAAPVA